MGGAPQSGRRLLKSGRGPRTAARVLGAGGAGRLLLTALGTLSRLKALIFCFEIWTETQALSMPMLKNLKKI